MRRFFYIDPLAAAWMAKHFGMKIKCVMLGNLENWSDAEDTIRHGLSVHPELADVVGEKYFVHPESLPLLEPQVGDCLYFPKAIEPYTKCRENGNDLTQLHMSFARYKIGEGDCQIIQRNGFTFMWPESEVA